MERQKAVRTRAGEDVARNLDGEHGIGPGKRNVRVLKVDDRQELFERVHDGQARRSVKDRLRVRDAVRRSGAERWPRDLDPLNQEAWRERSRGRYGRHGGRVGRGGGEYERSCGEQGCETASSDRERPAPWKRELMVRARPARTTPGVRIS